jgi:hypothetical protein
MLPKEAWSLRIINWAHRISWLAGIGDAAPTYKDAGLEFGGERVTKRACGIGQQAHRGVERACRTRNSADWLIDLGSMEQALFICSYFAHLKRAINRAFGIRLGPIPRPKILGSTITKKKPMPTFASRQEQRAADQHASSGTDCSAIHSLFWRHH